MKKSIMLLPETSFRAYTELSVAKENASPAIWSRAKSEAISLGNPSVLRLNLPHYLPHIFFSLSTSSQVASVHLSLNKTL